MSQDPVNFFECCDLIYGEINNTIAYHYMSSVTFYRDSFFYISFFEFNICTIVLTALVRAFSNISTVISIPIAFPEALTLLADKNTSIPPPEPMSTTTSPSRISAKKTGAPQPTPNIEDSGTDSSSLLSYPIFLAI